MKFHLFDTLRTIPHYDNVEVEILTIEDLKALATKHGQSLIIDFDTMSIEIYNDYRE